MRPPDDTPGGGTLPAERAFVLHLRGDLDPTHDRLAGRIEHIVSGRTFHFESLQQLVEFLRQMTTK